ncbi:hypothetical protein [Octadecabacter ascidiaceicola]|uniref:Uncharacterized protein n=1 Tax=Octadecabacter ascidiaceicola TaxID=1655543 RepID=A0A238K503_9RHOB|nr:hypothetical protein [Octadecabacter ascidiaceicola]SMX37991.1 hypothetical protein OCA8868_01635 [Octadecabacter ascidiaceicola]
MTRPARKDIAVAFGLVGILTAFALVVFGDLRELHDPWTGPIGVVIIAGPSAWMAGFLFGGMFGQQGAMGWGLALLGACLSTLLGAAIGGTIVLPLFGTIIAPFALLDQAIAHPTIALVWLCLMAVLHLALLKSKG